MDKFNEIFSRNLRAFMSAFNYTQKDLAKLMGVSEASVSNWMTGAKVPRADKVDKLCEIFDCRRSDFLTEKDITPMSPSVKQHMKNYSQLTEEWRKTIDELIANLQAEEPDAGKIAEVTGKILQILQS